MIDSGTLPSTLCQVGLRGRLGERRQGGGGGQRGGGQEKYIIASCHLLSPTQAWHLPRQEPAGWPVQQAYSCWAHPKRWGKLTVDKMCQPLSSLEIWRRICRLVSSNLSLRVVQELSCPGAGKAESLGRPRFSMHHRRALGWALGSRWALSHSG